MNVALKVQEETAVTVEEDTYDEAREGDVGWCPSCEDFTTADVLATETAVACSSCSEQVVVGAAHALKNGFISVERAVLT